MWDGSECWSCYIERIHGGKIILLYIFIIHNLSFLQCVPEKTEPYNAASIIYNFYSLLQYKICKITWPVPFTEYPKYSDCQ